MNMEKWFLLKIVNKQKPPKGKLSAPQNGTRTFKRYDPIEKIYTTEFRN